MAIAEATRVLVWLPYPHRRGIQCGASVTGREALAEMLRPSSLLLAGMRLDCISPYVYSVIVRINREARRAKSASLPESRLPGNVPSPGGQ